MIKADTPFPIASDLIEESLHQARMESARYMNRVRFAFASALVLLFLYGGFVLKLDSFRQTSWLILVYWILAGILLAGSQKISGLLSASRYAVPLLDMPFATLVQWQRLESKDADSTTAIFSLCVFLFLVMLSSFSMRTRQTFVCAAIGTVFFWLLAERVGLLVISFISAPIILFLTAWTASSLSRRQSGLVRESADRQARRDRLALYFSPGVAEVIERRDDMGEGEACELSVMFCDIRDFTTMSEAMEARDVVRLLNDFHGGMVDTIFRYGGTLDKYLGDGLLAYFNAPVPQHDHAERSVSCALAMIDRLTEINRDRAERGDPSIRMGIGIHAGQAVVGNVGAPHRREFTAIGDTVNVASRLQSMTRKHGGVDLLVSEAVVNECSEGSGLRFDPVAEVEVRGRSQHLKIFRPYLSS